MRPAPIGSGSSVSSGRCCAIAASGTHTMNETTATIRSIGLLSSPALPAPPAPLELFAAVEKQRDGAVVDQRYLHRCLEFARRHRQPARLQLSYDFFVQRPRDIGRRRMVE